MSNLYHNPNIHWTYMKKFWRKKLVIWIWIFSRDPVFKYDILLIGHKVQKRGACVRGSLCPRELVPTVQGAIKNIARGTKDPGYWVYNLNYFSDWNEFEIILANKIWSRFWNLVKILKFGGNSETWWKIRQLFLTRQNNFFS